MIRRRNSLSLKESGSSVFFSKAKPIKRVVNKKGLNFEDDFFDIIEDIPSLRKNPDLIYKILDKFKINQYDIKEVLKFGRGGDGWIEIITNRGNDILITESLDNDLYDFIFDEYRKLLEFEDVDFMLKYEQICFYIDTDKLFDYYATKFYRARKGSPEYKRLRNGIEDTYGRNSDNIIDYLEDVYGKDWVKDLEIGWDLIDMDVLMRDIETDGPEVGVNFIGFEYDTIGNIFVLYK